MEVGSKVISEDLATPSVILDRRQRRLDRLQLMFNFSLICFATLRPSLFAVER